MVENDDDERGDTDSYASYIEWTAPKTGDYYIMVEVCARSPPPRPLVARSVYFLSEMW
jgi:hypothetical protein